jgi:hypothetical protein
MSTERRQSRRRSLPFVRSAVLELGETSHIVVLTDLSVEGAFLTTRLPFDLPAPQDGQSLKLRLIIPRDSREVCLPCELVRRSERYDAASGHPSGMAVRFREMDADLQRRVEEFALEGFRPSAAPTPLEHFEHRIVERPSVDMIELNRFGRDGWQLVSVFPSAAGFKLVLLRRI